MASDESGDRFAAGAGTLMTIGRRRAAWRWLVVEWNWPAAGLLAAVLIAGLLPVLLVLGEPSVFWIALQLPTYLVHQADEHVGDRFRRHLNALLGTEALSRPAAFWINSVGVWGVDLLALLLAVFADLAWGFIAIYLTLFNALVHMLVGVIRRESNPGLVTAVVLFLPVGGIAWWVLQERTTLGPIGHLACLAPVVVEHAIIVIWALRGRSAPSRTGL